MHSGSKATLKISWSILSWHLKYSFFNISSGKQQMERLKAHHRRAEPVKVQMRIRMRYGLTIPHFTQKGADWKKKKGGGWVGRRHRVRFPQFLWDFCPFLNTHISPTSLSFLILSLQSSPSSSPNQILSRSQTDPVSLTSKNWDLSPWSIRLLWTTCTQPSTALYCYYAFPGCPGILSHHLH